MKKGLIITLALLAISVVCIALFFVLGPADGDCNCKQCDCTPCNRYSCIMHKMMADMDKVSTKTNIETYFLQQMILHHQAAVDMAKYQLENGSDSEMIQLAKSIIAEQQSEIEVMEHLISLQKDSKNKITQDYLDKMSKTMADMMHTMPTTPSQNPDHAFAEYMLPHHTAAVDMANVLLQFNPEQQVLGFAEKLIADQQVEIKIMRDYLQEVAK